MMAERHTISARKGLAVRVSILHGNGTAITARSITEDISEIVAALAVRPIKKERVA
jgi:hypothetical protein